MRNPLFAITRSNAKPRSHELNQARAGAYASGPHLQKNAEPMIDIHWPKLKAILILPGKSTSKTGGRADFQIVEDDYGAHRRILHREKKRILAFGWIRRAVDQN